MYEGLRSEPVAQTLVVSLLHISDRVAEKLAERHDLDPEEVRSAVEGVGGLPFRWGEHPQTGVMRALVSTAVRSTPVLVVLYPSRSGNAEEWHLGSAYPDHPST